jgi:hypothetical protein
MYLRTQAATSASTSISWPTVILVLGLATLVMCLFLGVMAWVQESRKLKITAEQEDALRKLVDRYEKLAESTLDAQQRVAADVSELRSRASAIEQILRTVD